MKLFVSDTCPRCIPLKRMNDLRTNPIEVINLSKYREYIEQHNLVSVPVLLIDEKELVTDIQEIVKIIKGE